MQISVLLRPQISEQKKNTEYWNCNRVPGIPSAAILEYEKMQ